MKKTREERLDDFKVRQGMSEGERETLFQQEAFSLFDEDNNGLVSAEDLGKVGK